MLLFVLSRESAHSIAMKLGELYEMATKMVFDSYGVAKHHESNIALTSYLFRFFKYRTRRDDETDLGLVCHTDRTFMSIVYQNQVEGLQVKTKEGQWIDVNPSPTKFLVIAGDIIGVCDFLSYNYVYFFVNYLCLCYRYTYPLGFELINWMLNILYKN